MIFETLVTWTILLNFVSAPPPLRVELAAEKENAKQQLNIPEKFPDFVIDKDDKISNIILEDDGYADDIIDSNDADDFEPIYLPKDFVSYDLNGDRSIDINELAAVTGAMENIEQAFNASDTDGDGKISETEFYNGPLNFDFEKDKENGTVDSDSIELDNIEDIDEKLIDTDNWETPEDGNKMGIGDIKIQDNILYTDDNKISTKNLDNLDTVIFRHDNIDLADDGISNEDSLNDEDMIGNDDEIEIGDDEGEDEDQYDDDIYDDEDEETDDDFDKAGNEAIGDDNDIDDNDENDDDEIDNDDSNDEDDDVDDNDEIDNDMDNNYEDKDDDDDLYEGDNNRNEDDLDEDVDLGGNIDNISSTDNDELNKTEDIVDGDVIKDKYDADEVNVNDDKTQ